MPSLVQWKLLLLGLVVVVLLLPTPGGGILEEPWELKGGTTGSRASVSWQMSNDPEAKRDSFDDLSARELAQLARPSPRWRAKLQDSHLHISVEVLLVGFAGDGQGGLQLDVHELALYLDALHSDMDWQAPSVAQQAHDSPQPQQNKTLPVQFYFSVRHANRRLLSSAADAVAKAVRGAPEDQDVVAVPHSSVDAVVEKDAASASLSYSLYILNLPANGRPFIYSYGDGGCPGSLWTSRGSARYAWVDLSAGPVSYGPQEGASGTVMPWSFPNASSWAASRDKRGLSVEIVGLIHSACKHLVVRQPAGDSPAWHPLHGARVVVVRMSDIADRPAADDRTGLRAEMAVLHEELEKLQLGTAGVSVEEVELPFAECSRCVAAYTRALHSHLVTNQDGQLELRTSLDLAELQQWLSPLLEPGSFQYTDREAEVMSRLSHRPDVSPVVPVYLFDLNIPDLLLLDGTHQAAVIDKAVVAVRTRFSEHQTPNMQGAPTAFQCQGSPVRLDVDLLARPILAALLQAVWAVQPSETHVDTKTGYVRRDFLWSVGSDLFTPLGQGRRTTFSDRDAALRNVLIPRLLKVRNYLEDVLDVLQKLSPGRSPLEAIQRHRRRLFVQRTNYLMHKYVAALNALSLNHFNTSNHLTLSMLAFDVKALRTEMRELKTQVRTTLSCFQNSGAGELLLWGGGFCALLGAIGLYVALRLKGRHRKPKFF
mmetsp:Transcript_5016/g.14032  ORF Transcript_5016/g.14032 Transcript_5016/m.14032 type:complete len:710 (-) Transcript_5016:284-2413(-)